MADRVRVLVTGAGALLGQGIIKALRASSLPVEIIAADPSPYSAGLYLADGAHLVPFASDPGYLHALRKVIRDVRPRIVLVGTDVELPVFAAAREELESDLDTRILVSSPEVVAIANDKWLTNRFLRENGFDHPMSALPPKAWELAEQIGYPLIVKPRVGARSRGVSVAHNANELRAALSAADGLVVQECVGDEHSEYTAGAVYFPGQPCVSIIMRRDLRDGNTYRAFVEESPELNAIIQRMAITLAPCGPANFQFRLDANGRVKVFEINGRFSGTTPLRAQAGFNEVEMCLRHILTGERVAQPAVKHLTFLRYWTEVAVPPERLLPNGTPGS